MHYALCTSVPFGVQRDGEPVPYGALNQRGAGSCGRMRASALRCFSLAISFFRSAGGGKAVYMAYSRPAGGRAVQMGASFYSPGYVDTPYTRDFKSSPTEKQCRGTRRVPCRGRRPRRPVDSAPQARGVRRPPPTGGETRDGACHQRKTCRRQVSMASSPSTTSGRFRWGKSSSFRLKCLLLG